MGEKELLLRRKSMKQRCGTCGDGRVNKAYFKEKNASLSYAIKCSLDSKNKHKDSVCSNWKEKEGEGETA